jgi:hypothetical protein
MIDPDHSWVESPYPLGRLIHRWQWRDNRVPNYELLSDIYDFINTGFFSIHYPNKLNKVSLSVENKGKEHKNIALWVNDKQIGVMQDVEGLSQKLLSWDVSVLRIDNADVKIALSGSTNLILKKMEFE